MKYLNRLYMELKSTVLGHKAGTKLTPPDLLSKFDYKGGRVNYLRMGIQDSDEVFVFVHGFGGFFMDWPRIMGPLSHSVPTIALDLPGWGFSDPLSEDSGIEDHVDVIKSLTEKLGFKKVTLVGISYGAAVSWASACENWPALKRLVLLNPMPPNPLKYLHSRAYQSFFILNSNKFLANQIHRFYNRIVHKKMCLENIYNKKFLDKAYLEVGFHILKQPKIAGSIHQFALLARHIDWTYWENQLQKIDIPVFIFHGREDRVFGLAAAEKLHNLIPDSKLIKISDCGHAMMFDQHRQVTNFLLELLEKDSDFKEVS